MHHLKRILSLILICIVLGGTLSGVLLPKDLLAEVHALTWPSWGTEPESTPASDPEASIPSTPPLPPSTGFTLQKPFAQAPGKPNVSIPKLNADRFFIYDTRFEDFLYINCEISKAIYPASTTKLFTTYVALRYLKPDTIVTVGSELSYVASDASVAGFQAGDKVSAEALAYAALLPSGCDASYILAAAAGRAILEDQSASAKKAINAFMDACNRMAEKLGMENTNFVTPDGYHHSKHRISMQAYSIIARLCLEDQTIGNIVCSPKATIRYTNSRGSTRTLELKNTNKNIQPSSEYYNPYAIGLKTGYTSEAGYCLLTAYKIDGRYIIIGVFGCDTASSRFKDTNKLFDAYLPYL